MPRAKRKIGSVRGKLDRDVFFETDPNLPKVLEIDIESLVPNPDQPRKKMDPATIQELAQSIEKHGLIQPITVQYLEDVKKYMVVAGERRARAHQLLERNTIFAILTTGHADEIALIENLQREDLSPLEEAEALGGLMERHQYSQTQLGQVVGKGRRTINELLSLNNLPESIKSECRTSRSWVPKSMLVELSRESDTTNQEKLWQHIRDGKLTVKAAREEKQGGKPRNPRTKSKPIHQAIKAGKTFYKLLGRVQRVPKVEREELLAMQKQIDNLIQELLD